MNSRASSVLMIKPSAVAQSVEHPSKVPVWCNTSDVGSNQGTAVQGGRKTVAKKIIIIIAALSGECRKSAKNGEKIVIQ